MVSAQDYREPGVRKGEGRKEQWGKGKRKCLESSFSNDSSTALVPESDLQAVCD